jgi:hypothetical protein
VRGKKNIRFSHGRS